MYCTTDKKVLPILMYGVNIEIDRSFLFSSKKKYDTKELVV